MSKIERKVGVVGSYDGGIHPGHQHFLRRVRRYGSQFHFIQRAYDGKLRFLQRSKGELYVFVVPDEVIRRNKNREPLYSQAERVKHLQDTGIPTHVIPLNGTDQEQINQILAIKPNVWVRTPEQELPFDLAVMDGLRRLGSTVKVVQRYKPEKYSTTKVHFSH